MKKRVVMLAGLLCAGMVSANTWYVATDSANDGPGTSWNNAYHIIQHAVHVASPGDTILVTNGVYDSGGEVTPGYNCTNRVVITRNITLRSVHGPDVTIIDGLDSVRGVFMTNGVLTGFTIRNGRTLSTGDKIHDSSGGGLNLYGGSGIVSNCIITANTSYSGGGGSYYGTFYDCTFFGNSADGSGGGNARGTLYNCTVSNNISSYSGGGTYYGTLYNCILFANLAYRDGGGNSRATLYNCAIFANSAKGFGGGTFRGTLNNCTISGNRAVKDGGGSYYGTLNNCISYFNTADGDGDNWHGGTIFCSCTTPLPAGKGNITNNPVLLSASHIATESPCVGMGNDAYTSGTDIDGESWNPHPSMGCDEPQVPLSGTLSVSIYAEYTSAVPEYSLAFGANIQGEILSNRWSFGDGNLALNQAYVNHSWASPGTYQVVLTAWNDEYNKDGISSTVTVHIVKDDYYVDAANISPSPPYSSWKTAANNIQDAVDIAALGSTVWVTNGIYSNGSRETPGYDSTNRVAITKDIVVKSINGSEGTIIDGLNRMRGVYISDGILDGFTVRNGKTMSSGSWAYDRCGGGVNLYNGSGVVSNCVISGNYSSVYGGGCYRGSLYNCTISSNQAASLGGGSEECQLENCMIYGNTTPDDGGGCEECFLINCAVNNNTSGGDGGGCYDCMLYNCTVSGNRASRYGGGCSEATLYNCIVYHNAAYKHDNWYDGSCSYCCTTPLPSGTGNITNNPILISASHIAGNSPCVGAGSSTYTNGIDIDNESWAVPPSMGCDEPLAPFSGNLSVSIDTDYTSAVPGHAIAFRADIQGEVYYNEWSFGDGTTAENQTYVKHAWTAPGDYAVLLGASNDDHHEVTHTVTVHIARAEFFVNVDNPSPVYPYTSWQTAANTIQDAVDAASGTAGATVWVEAGTYNSGSRVTPGHICPNRLIIADDITVRSQHGPTKTIIDGSGSVRCVYMTAGQLAGFTLQNGSTLNSGDDLYDQSGGGLNLYGSSGSVSNCIIKNNFANNDGGGSYYGNLRTCLFYDNASTNSGGGSAFGTFINCTMTRNTSGNKGGGCCYAFLTNCIAYFNSASSFQDSYHCQMSHCCASDAPAGDGNTTVGPMFAKRVDDNFHLSYGSVAIDTGDNTCQGGNTDLDGIPLPLDGDNNGSAVIDMGCYEYLTRTADSDGDTMADAWELNYGLDPTDPSDQSLNPDSDPFNNREEFLADTDPTDPADWFHIVGIDTISNGIKEIWFNSSDQRDYSLLRCDNLLSNNWTVLPAQGGSGGLDSLQDDTTNAPMHFYKVQVMLPPE